MVRFIAAALALSLIQACTNRVNVTDTETDNHKQLSELYNEILEIAKVDGPLSSCRTAELGSKPCGGPYEYVIYSMLQTEVRALIEKIELYNKFSEDLSNRDGYISDCEYVTKPKVGTRNGRCVIMDEVASIYSELSQDDIRPIISLDGQTFDNEAYSLISAEVQGDTLIMEVGYAGGCVEHDFILFDTGIATRSIPPQHLLRLLHVANDDICEAYITQKLFFNLLPLKKIYENLGSVDIQLEGLNEMPRYSF